MIPVHKALQGHPEAGALWEKHIVGILRDPDFKSTAHKCNLYRGCVDEELALICRQVNDFAVASANTEAAEKLIAHVNSKVTTESQGLGQPTQHGISNWHDGVDVHQTKDCIKLSCETPIDCMLQTHGWEQPPSRESDRHNIVPISSKTVKHLQSLDPGPAEGTKEVQDIEE